MQAKEVAGACWGWESMRVTARSMLDAKGPDKMIPVLAHRKIPDPELANALIIPDLIAKRGGKKHAATYTAWVNQYEFQRPFVAPPGVPAKQLGQLREGFAKTLEDPEFLKEAEDAKLIIEYVSGKEIEGYVDQILGMSPESKEALDFLVRKRS